MTARFAPPIRRCMRASKINVRKVIPVCPRGRIFSPSRPHEGASGSGSEVRAGSGACARGRPNPGLGRLSRNGFMPALSVPLQDGGRSESLLAERRARHGAEHNRPPGTKTGRQQPGLDSDIVAAAGGDVGSIRSDRHAGRDRQKSPHTWRRATGFLVLGTAARRPCPLLFSHALACGGDDARLWMFWYSRYLGSCIRGRLEPRDLQKKTCKYYPPEALISAKTRPVHGRATRDERFVTAFYHLRLESAAAARQVRPSAAGALVPVRRKTREDWT
jgi:hypothetical protein